VSVPSRYMLTAALGLGLVQALWGQEPARLGVDRGQAVQPRSEPSANQRMAETIAEQLRQSAVLQGYQISINFQSGAAEVVGAVTTQAQHDEALRIVQGVPGVERVRDHLGVVPPMGLQQIQAAMPPVGEAAPLPGGPAMPPAGMVPPPIGPGPYAVPIEPMPMFPYGYGSPYVLNTPRMPPYAWPTYAPYNNYARNAIPVDYPYNSWPFIGPPYPFPKVPLGWRQVKLEYQDGHWWFGKVATCHDWWRLRYW
jgi:BON domain-containing protein